MMKHDKDTLEKFAREQYNFAVPGEDVYIVEQFPDLVGDDDFKILYKSKE